MPSPDRWSGRRSDAPARGVAVHRRRCRASTSRRDAGNAQTRGAVAAEPDVDSGVRQIGRTGRELGRVSIETKRRCGDPEDSGQPREQRLDRVPSLTRRRPTTRRPDRPAGRLDACAFDHTAGRSDMPDGTTSPDTDHASAAPPRRGGDVVDRHDRQLDGTGGPRRCPGAGLAAVAATPRRGVGDVRRRRRVIVHRVLGVGRRPMVAAGRRQPIAGSAGRARPPDRPGRRDRRGRSPAPARSLDRLVARAKLDIAAVWKRTRAIVRSVRRGVRR